VNVWLIAATVLLAGLVPCGLVCLRAPLLDAIAGVELATSVVTLVLVLLAEGFHRSSYFTLPIVLAAMSFAGGLALVRFLARSRL
jgi:multicomponent Na+:H+ antiporter subunit F